MGKVFISYTTKNSEVALNIVDFLEGNGIECFIAERDISGGNIFTEKIIEELNSCMAVVLVASAAINDSKHVQKEVFAAFNKDKAILPVFIENFDLIAKYEYCIGDNNRILAYPDSIKSYQDRILKSLLELLPEEYKQKTASAKKEKTEKVSTVFDYIADRGVMINPKDHQRNVSFRTDTFISLLGGIYEKVAKISDEDTAEKIFYDSGIQSGRNFAERINSQWNTSPTVEEMPHRLSKWCEFDSEVGWGYFTSKLDIDRENGTFSGNISIREAFIVDTIKKRKICSFIRGYCTGVVSTLLGFDEIELTCSKCPLKNRFECSCVFDIKSIG